MRPVAALLAVSTLLLALLAPRAALACPACAANDGGSTVLRAAVLGTMILLPWAVGGIAVHVIRRLNEGER
ncbi:MAG: hypothetical protein AABZ30_11785 [Myxococcota bacterium]